MKIKESDIREYFSAIKTEATAYFDKYVKADWTESLAFYTDSYEFKKKMDWQSKLRDPITDNLVHRLSNFFSRVLIEVGDRYFTVDHPNTLRSLAYKELLSSVLNMNNFPMVFSDALKYGLIMSLSVLKVQYQYEVLSTPVYDPTRNEFSLRYDRLGKVRIFPINPMNIRLDPNGDSYIIEEQVISLAQFESLARSNGWTHIEDAVKDYGVSASYGRPLTDKSVFPEIVLHHVHTKYLTDARGLVLDKDVYFIIANGKYVVYYGKNLLPDGKFPYVVGQPVRSLVGRYGRSYVSRLRDIIRANADALNLILDSFVLSVLGIYEYDINKIVKGTEHQFTASLTPGKFYPVTERGAVSAIGNPTIPSMASQMIFILDRLLQNRSYQTEFFMGMPTAKGRPTATEVGTKLQESSSFFTDIASEIERGILEPLFELTLITELIHLDDTSHVRLESGISNVDALRHLESLGFGERIEDIRNFRVRVGGISERIRKSANLGKIIQVLSVIGNIPAVSSSLSGRKLVEKIMDSLGMSPDELFDMSLLPEEGQLVAERELEGG